MPLESCLSSVNIGHQFVVKGLCATMLIAPAFDVASRGATRNALIELLANANQPGSLAQESQRRWRGNT
jgi:hypothetical protein